MQKIWNRQKSDKEERIRQAFHLADGKIIPTDRIAEFLGLVMKSGDKVVLEGDNQKQAAFLSTALNQVDPEKINNLHLILSSLSRDDQLDLFDKGIASVVDFCFAGPTAVRLAKMVSENRIKIGSIHTYLELYARLFVDLIPNICLVAANQADRNGNLFTGPNTEDTPTIIEATAFKSGIVIAQVNKIVDCVDRVDIPGDWVDFVVESDEPYPMEALFTRDPAIIQDTHVLQAMLTIKGIYARHGVTTLNHGVGFNGSAIELLLPTYGESLGLKGKICQNWVLNPHPTLIPAIESGWVQSICSFGGEVGMEKYVAARPDVFFTGVDGSLRSNRAMAQLAGLYGIDLFLGATLQMDYAANSSTVTAGRLSGFGGAPNMGHNSGGRRHSSPAWKSLVTDPDSMIGGKKLVVQIQKSSGKKGPNFVEQLDAVAIGKKAGMDVVPVMIYGDDVTHVVTEQGLAYLYMTDNLEQRKLSMAAIAQGTPLGDLASSTQIEDLRRKGIVVFPEDLGISKDRATRDLLAAKSLQELVEWSGGLYEIPESFLKQDNRKS